mmetsp:Transcript_125428/g.354812  ORF Transcript_125428/g.354812 Transcript_125428/m.354812 type:complete len:223 (-) Transcript_125428:330-998(-)
MSCPSSRHACSSWRTFRAGRLRAHSLTASGAAREQGPGGPGASTTGLRRPPRGSRNCWPTPRAPTPRRSASRTRPTGAAPLGRRTRPAPARPTRASSSRGAPTAAPRCPSSSRGRTPSHAPAPTAGSSYHCGRRCPPASPPPRRLIPRRTARRRRAASSWKRTGGSPGTTSVGSQPETTPRLSKTGTTRCTAPLNYCPNGLPSVILDGPHGAHGHLPPTHCR